jgi:hypothetical protein
MTRSKEFVRGVTVVIGFAAFVAIVSYAIVRAIDTGLPTNGVAPSSQGETSGRGLAIGFAFGFGVLGFIGNAAVLSWAWLVQPRFGAVRLAILQIVVTGATIAAMGRFQILGLLVGAPVASLVSYVVLRLWH